MSRRAERWAPVRCGLIFDVYLMGALPEVFGGIRIALAGAWGLEAFSELLGAPKGIGRVIQGMAADMDTQMMFAAIVALSVVAFAFDVAIGAVFGFVTRWRRTGALIRGVAARWRTSNCEMSGRCSADPAAPWSKPCRTYP